jgi:DNA polymerase-1
MFVGEVLGSDEVIRRVPFVGAAGNCLNECLQEAGLLRQDVFVTNVLRCRPTNNELPKQVRERDALIEACLPYLQQEIAEIKPTIIVAMGNTAHDGIRTREELRAGGRGGITKDGVHGVANWSEQYGCWILPTYHPAYIIRQRMDLKPTLIEDFKVAKEYADHGAPSRVKLPQNYIIASTLEDVKRIRDLVLQAKLLAVDTETDSLKFWQATILCVSLAWGPGQAGVIPLYLNRVESYWPPEVQQEVLKIVQEILASAVPKVFQNAKFDLKCFRHFGQRIGVALSVKCVVFDTMLGHHLYDENAEGEHDLGVLAYRFTDLGGYEKVLDQEKKKIAQTSKPKMKLIDVTYDLIPIEILYRYACCDADTTLRAKVPIQKKLVEDGCDWVMKNITMPLVGALAEVEFEGITLDVSQAQYLVKEYTRIIDEQYEVVGDLSDIKQFNTERLLKFQAFRRLKWRESSMLQKRHTEDDYATMKDDQYKAFSPRSPKDLAEFLFDRLQLPVLKKTAGDAASTDAEVLEALAGRHPVVDCLLKIRSYEKMCSTYVENALNSMDPVNNRVHTTYMIHGTAHGRLSSRKPNLQNLPVRHKYIDTSEVRRMYVADLGCLIYQLDYKQAEVRWWCQLSKDRDLLALLESGVDIHRLVASEAFGVPQDQVTKSQRQVAKNIIFGRIYGRGVRSIVEEMQQQGETEFGVPEGERISNLLSEMFSTAHRWLEDTKQFALTYGYVTNYFGRRRRLPNIWSSEEANRAEAYRQAVNAPVAGSSSDMLSIKTPGIVKICKQFDYPRVRMILTLHDAAYINCPPELEKQVIPLIMQHMEEPIQGVPRRFKTVRVPMKVDLKRGPTWGDLEEYELPT